MSGALLQLVAIGAQDALLIGDEGKVTFFQLVTRCHTNFAVESIDQTVNGTPGFGRSISCTVSRNGDLVSRMYVEATLPELTGTTEATAGKLKHGFSWIPNVGNALIKEADVEIGGQRIDRHYGEWLHIWNELAGDRSHEDGYNRMIGNVPELVSFNQGASTEGVSTEGESSGGFRTSVPEYQLLIPLQFWFCRSPGLALPLIALQYHEVKINITFNEKKKLLRHRQSKLQQLNTLGRDPLPPDTFWSGDSFNTSWLSGAKELEVKLWIDYIYLDNDERRRFATTPHNYLIDQLQSTGKEAIRGEHDRYRLNFNHPVKELIWYVESDKNPFGVFSYPGYQSIQEKNNNYTTMGGASQMEINEIKYLGNNPIKNCKLILNGHDRFKERAGTYFDSVQTRQHHTNCPERPGLNVYSFGLKPEEFQPSGSCNFSRIDNATLDVTFENFSSDQGAYDSNKECSGEGYFSGANLVVYAVNYNQLKIISGMGGLTYSN